MGRYFLDTNGNYYEALTDIETPDGHTLVEKRLPPPNNDLPVLTCSAFQAKAILMQQGLFDDAETAVTAIGGLTLLAWQEAREWRSNSQAVQTLADILNLTESEVRNLFLAAQAIEA